MLLLYAQYMSDEVFFNKMVTKGLEPIESDGRFFEGYLTVQVKDKQGEVTIVDELYKVLPIWMDRGAPITDTHSNRGIGKGINFARSDYTDVNGDIYPAIKVTGKIYNDYELDNEIWNKIKSGEYKGLSFGGSTKTDREPMRMKDGSIAYSLSKLEHYEVAVCRDPAVPLAVITDVNPIAKANMNCDHTGCYVTKPILGAPDFESATRKVMAESDVPKENAKRIVGAAEHKKCDVCGLPKVNKYEETGQLGGKESDEDILEYIKNPPKKKPQGVGDIGDISGKKFTGKLKKPLGKNTFKNIVATNKILGLYQGNAIPLARILDKDATRAQILQDKLPALPKKDERQAHGGQSARARMGTYYDDTYHSGSTPKGQGADKKIGSRGRNIQGGAGDARNRGSWDSKRNQKKKIPAGGEAPIGKGMFDKILKRGRIAGDRTPPSAKKPLYGGGRNQDVKRPKSPKSRENTNAKFDFARHGGENMSLGDLTNYIRNIGAAGGDTSQFDAQLARAKERENSKQRDDKKASGKDIKRKLRNLITAPDVYPSEIKGTEKKSLFDRVKEDIAKKNYKK